MAQQETTGFFSALEDAKWDVWLAATVLGLVVFGIIMVYSASGYVGEVRFHNHHYFLLRQLLWVTLGMGAMLVMMRIDYLHYWKPGVVYSLLIISAILLIAVFFFPTRNNAHRWIIIGQFSAQPSEIAKIALIIFLSRFLSRRLQEKEISNFWMTVAPATALAGVLALLILKEPDLGTTLMLGVVFITMMFASGVRVLHLMAFLPVVLLVGYVYILGSGFRMGRIRAFFDPEAYAMKEGFQTMQSLIAIGSGGISGFGLGQGRQKLMFLPEPHNDFIFAVIGEELGFIGAVTVVLIFGFLLWRGIQISRRAPDKFGQLLALGLTVMLVAQAFFNISVVLNLLPNKGIPLPFVSAGGSSLLFAMASIGILLNISEHGKR
jgi:cell division protein FtsW